jgi:adenine phosphoribosyltransferase
MLNFKDHIRSILDFPKKGIVFRDITTLLKDSETFHKAVDALCVHFANYGAEVIVAPESRGFIFGAAMAYKMGLGFVPVRKPGKLPATTASETYELEYGTDTIEIHRDAIQPGTKALLIDDLLATGGTMKAACKLVEKLGGKVVGIGFLIELSFLKGREKLKGYPVFTLIDYERE